MSKDYIQEIKKQDIYWKHNLTAKQIKISKENINKILVDTNFSKNIGLLSLDIDSNDYWVIEAMNVSPDIIVCEYNGIFGDNYKLTVPYKKNFDRTKEHYSNLYYGCSINALISLMFKKGFIFIGTNSAGNNAYFLQEKNFRIIKNKIRQKKIFLPKFRESRGTNNQKTFLSIEKSINLIKNKYVYDLSKKRLIKIKELKNMLSQKQIVYFKS